MHKKLLLAGIILLGGFTMASAKTWDKVFAKSDDVTVKKVHFTNRYGIKLTGDLYTPKGTAKDAKLPAIVVSGPFGAVKEQVSGLYAQTLAQRGFITLAFDPSFTGESAGTPRHMASPDINTEDFSAAVDYLTTLPNVAEDKIGLIGICGFGGFGLNAAAMDTRIKASAIMTMYDMTRVAANGYFDAVDEKGRHENLKRLNNQRTQDYKNGTYAHDQGLPEKLTGQEPQFVQDYWHYYKTPRGFHKRSINSNGQWITTSSLSLINMPILQRSSEIQSAVLIVHGEKAHSRYLGEDAFKKLKGSNKELYIVPGASHVDLYDNLEKIPFDKLESFFKTHLK